MPTREILMSHPVSTLRAEIAKANLSAKADKNLFKRAVSKMRKDELIAIMLAPAYKDRFHHIKMREKKAGKPKKKPRFPAVEEEKEKRAKAAAKKAKEEEKAKEITIVPKRRRKKKPPLSKSAVEKAEAKGSKRDKVKLVSFEPKLTVTKADGSVKEVKKRVKSKK